MEIIEVLHQNYHMQGFTSDKEKYMYWSFTDSLVKTTLSGTVICQVHITGGHLGGLDYHDGKIYVSYLKNPEPFTFFGDWASFEVYVFAEEDLKLLKIINIPECLERKKTKLDGFQGIDGIAFGKVPGCNDYKMLVAVALDTNEKYSNQCFLEVNEDGVIENTYRIPAGNKVFGIQNLDYEEDTGCFWFTTYGASEKYMEPETLYCVAPDMKTVLKKYEFSTPYGFECLGNGEYFASLQAGVNGNRSGYAYKVKQDFFEAKKSEKEINEYVKSFM